MKTTKVTQNNEPTAEGIASAAKEISKKGNKDAQTAVLPHREEKHGILIEKAIKIY